MFRRLKKWAFKKAIPFAKEALKEDLADEIDVDLSGYYDDGELRGRAIVTAYGEILFDESVKIRVFNENENRGRK